MRPTITVSTTGLSSSEISLLKQILPKCIDIKPVLTSSTSYLIAYRCVFTEKYVHALKWNIPIVNVEYFYKYFGDVSENFNLNNLSNSNTNLNSASFSNYNFSNTYDNNKISFESSNVSLNNSNLVKSKSLGSSLSKSKNQKVNFKFNNIESYIFNSKPFMGSSFCTSDVSNNVFRHYLELMGSSFKDDLDRSVDFLVYSSKKISENESYNREVSNDKNNGDFFQKYSAFNNDNLDKTLDNNLNIKRNGFSDKSSIGDNKNNLSFNNDIPKNYIFSKRENLKNDRNCLDTPNKNKDNLKKSSSPVYDDVFKKEKSSNIIHEEGSLSDKDNIKPHDSESLSNNIKNDDQFMSENNKETGSENKESSNSGSSKFDFLNTCIAPQFNISSTNNSLLKIDNNLPEKVIFALNNNIPIIDPKFIFENDFFLFKRNYYFNAYEKIKNSDAPENKEDRTENKFDFKIPKNEDMESKKNMDCDNVKRNSTFKLNSQEKENIKNYEDVNKTDKGKDITNKTQEIKEFGERKNISPKNSGSDIFKDIIFYIDPGLHTKLFNTLKKSIILNGGIRISSLENCTFILTNIYYKNESNLKTKNIGSKKDKPDIKGFIPLTEPRNTNKISNLSLFKRHGITKTYIDDTNQNSKSGNDIQESYDNYYNSNKYKILHYQYIFDCLECKLLLIPDFYVINFYDKNTIFSRNHVFCIDKELKDMKYILCNKIKAMGGVVKNNVESGITHLIVKSRNYKPNLYNKKTKDEPTSKICNIRGTRVTFDGLPYKIVEYDWIDQCLFAKKFIKEDKYLAKKPSLSSLINRTSNSKYSDNLNKNVRIKSKLRSLTGLSEKIDYKCDEEIIFQFTGLASSIKNRAIETFKKYNIKYVDSEKYENATHIIMGMVNTSEKFMCALARGCWILVPDFVEKYNGSETFNFDKYEWKISENELENENSSNNSQKSNKNDNIGSGDENNETSLKPSNPKKLYSNLTNDQKKVVESIGFWRKWVYIKKRYAFSGWIVKLYCEEPKRENLVRLVLAGGGKVVENACKKVGNITHVFISRKFIGSVDEEKFYSVNYIFSYLFSCNKRK